MAGMRIGQPGKKYGLILKGKAAAPLQKRTTFFDEEEEEGDERERRKQEALRREAHHDKLMKQAEQEHAKILEQDPTAFEYDALYDQVQEDRASQVRLRQRTEDVRRNPKYIAGLKAAAKQREIEEFAYLDRKLQRERQEEDKIYGTDEKFITGAYKRRLQELKRWKKEDQRKAALEAAQDPSKKGHMMDFYSNLWRDNVALGSDVRQRKEAEAKEGKGDGDFEPKRKKEEDQDAEEKKKNAEEEKEKEEKAHAKRVEAARDNVALGSDVRQGKEAEAKEGKGDGDFEPKRKKEEDQDAEEKKKNAEEEKEKEEKAHAKRVEAARERYLARKRSRQP